MKFKSGPLKAAAVVLVVLLVAVGVFFSFRKVVSAIWYVVMLFFPFILGYLFSQLINPLANWLQKRLKLPRQVSAILVIVLTVGIMGGILTAVIWKIVSEIRALYDQFPVIYESAQAAWAQISSKFANIYAMMPESVQATLDRIGTDISDSLSDGLNIQYSPMMRRAGDFAKSLPNIFIAIVVFILSLYFMVTDAKRVSAVVHRIVPRRVMEGCERIKEEIKKYLGGYVRAQLTIMGIAFVVLWIGLSILHVEYALLIALGIAVLDALPFFGSGAALWPWAAVSFIMNDPRRGVGLLIIYLTLALLRQFIEPKIVSTNIGLHPICTLMAMYVGFKLFSIGGMILGPLVLMLFVSIYHAGIFDGLIRFLKAFYKWIKAELKNIFGIFQTK